MKSNRLLALLPVIVAIALASGVYLGRKMSLSGEQFLFSNSEFSHDDKLQQIISYIKSDYVDSVRSQEIIEETIGEILQNLDPHSYYIPKQKYDEMNDPLEGEFEGIGVEFRIQEDTITVVQALAGGPSEELGIIAGDRIIEVEGEDVTGKTINNRRVVKLLKGPKGTVVNVLIRRKGATKPIDFAIRRDKIPVYSVEAEYMINETTGYVKVLRFAKDTHEEFMRAMGKLKKQGMTKLVLDLRNNTGGFMKSAIDMCDEFLPKGKLIVYTEGKARSKREYFATSRGKLEDIKVTILINENSASASEILAGALQDNDIGYIVGRRSFGKGLVQEGMQWPDGSAVRLTVARYYTPTGRSIQKSYEGGIEDYNNESYERYNNGELLSQDSIDFPDSLKYVTEGGKVVYGGGGIMPDVFVPIDTTGTSYYLGSLNYQGIFFQFGFHYVDVHRKELKANYKVENFASDFKVDAKLLEEMYAFAETKGIERDKEGAKVAEETIKNRLSASIGRNLYREKIFYQILNENDIVVKRAVDLLKKEAL
ncbi:MAG: S41 family peptidase [Flavobacteriales bacterium]|nr:S41 family peptidase [Flavobacteriales bacterium]